MSICEFEEREFETALYPQLEMSQNHLWSPGQVLEGVLGFDYALFSKSAFLWALHGYSSPLSGVVLNALAPPVAGLSRPMPNFSLNLFIQAKRPKPLVRASRKLGSLGITSPYWRFAIDQEQQKRLKALESAIGPDALVCYAAPAFHRATQLFAHLFAGSMVEHTTFPLVNYFASGHKAWNYSAPGCVGVANVRPERFSGPTLSEQIGRLLESRSESLETRPIEAISRLANSVDASVIQDQSPDGKGVALYRLRSDRIESATRRIRETEHGELVRNFLRIQNYSITFGTMWLTIGESKQN